MGPKNVIDTAYEMGVSKARHLPDVASIGLGAGEVTPLDMATAYAPLSNGGYRVAPLAIFKIVTPGRRGGRLRARSASGCFSTAWPTR